MSVTTIITITSVNGILPNTLRLAHSNVPIDTMIITPVSAAIGNCSITGAPHMMKESNPRDATIPESRARAPEEILIKL